MREGLEVHTLVKLFLSKIKQVDYWYIVSKEKDKYKRECVWDWVVLHLVFGV